MTNEKPELTRREVQVALGVARGRTCPEMGKTLRLSHESIKSLMKRLREKTGYRRKPQLAIWASDNKLWLNDELTRLKSAPRRRPVARKTKVPA